MFRLALLFVVCILWVETYCYGDESLRQRQAGHQYDRFGYHERRELYNLNSGPGELHRSRHHPFEWHRNGNLGHRLRNEGAGIHETRVQRMFHKEPLAVRGSKYNRGEQPMFDERQEELDKSDLMSAADASFRSFLTEQLTRKQNNDLKKKVVISRRDKNALFKGLTSNGPDLSRTDQIKRKEQPTIRKGAMDRDSSTQRAESGEESVMDEGKAKENFLIQDTENRKKDSKNIPNVEKWAEVEKPDGTTLSQRPRNLHDGRMRTKTASLKPLLDGILKEDRKSDPHPLYLKHRSHPLARESLAKPSETASFDPQLNGLSGFHEKHDSDADKRQSGLHHPLKPDTVLPKNSAKGKVTDDGWMNFRLHVGDSGSLKIELAPPKKTQTNDDDKAAPFLSPSFESFFSNNKQGFHNQKSSSDHEPEAHDDEPHRNSIWDSSSLRPAAFQQTDEQFPVSANDIRPGSTSRNIAGLLRRYSSVKHGESRAQNYNHEARLLMHRIDEDRPDSSDDTSSRFVAATAASASQPLPRTTIIDSVAIPLTVNVDDPIYSGCPVQKCTSTCPGDLRKLTVNSGCPTCECCPPVKCDRTCKMGYEADAAGCPTCHCLQE